MTLGIVRGLLTLILFGAFISLWVWAWSKQRRSEFEAAARLPLADDVQTSPRSDVT
jgi:cytochrome c oxidase cbb3-type subunit 4